MFAIRPEGGHLLVDLTGRPAKEEVNAMFRELRGAGGRGRALVELHVETCLGSLDTLEVVAGLRDLDFPAGYRIALLITDAAMRPSAEFAETVAFNRGIPVKVFDERDPAVIWLDS